MKKKFLDVFFGLYLGATVAATILVAAIAPNSWTAAQTYLAMFVTLIIMLGNYILLKLLAKILDKLDDK